MAADLQNARRRAEQDIEKAHKFSLEKIVNDLLPIIDSLERGLEMSDPANNAVKSVRDGMELTLKLFQDTLVRYKVEAINPQDQIFNPELHQAMSMQSDAEKKPNTILQVFQKGYLLNGRLLRPAMVVVNKV
ncbi:UNVERIFIED_CONTAM: hypothetical protein GTU68_056402 [Idotea baltica]|nr:hypothetical protein [Idotea baltica]